MRTFLKLLAVVLIHHPVSLETGLNAAEQAALADVERRLLPRLKRLIVTSNTTAETLETQFHIPTDRIHVVVPGTDDAPRCPGSAGCEMLSIGTLIPRKGHDVLLRALARLFDLDWHLTIAGAPDRDPAHAHGLMALTEELKIAHRVRFAGELVGDALEAAWRGADLFALATYYEGYGMAIAEALKRGLPVVVTAGGAAGKLITPECRLCLSGRRSRPGFEIVTAADLRHRSAARAWPSRPGRSAKPCHHGKPSVLRRLWSDRAPLGDPRRRLASMLLGAIADDFTGATDLCSMLVRGGMRTVQLIGTPAPDDPVPDADAVVVAIKSRTAPVRWAVEQSLHGARLVAAGGRAAVFL